MAHLSNILKAVETLNALQESDTSSDSGARKEKISCCTIIVEGICSPTIRQNPKFPQILTATIETLLALCNDNESDVRMVADESLNKIIRAMVDSNIVKIQIELYNEIKRNGPARILRAALWRFGLLSHMIRPSRGKAYVSNLIPCIVIIAHRSEDTVIETLSQSLPLIFKVLGPFMTDKDIKNLLKAFFENISSPQAAFRRAAANMILTTCTNCRKPQFFLNYVLNYLLDIMMSTKNAEDYLYTIIGGFGCLRVILPYICKPLEPQDIETQQIDSLLYIYELCLHYTKWHSDHNVVNAALETLAQLLKMPPKPLVSILLSSEGISQSKIILNQNAYAPSLGQMSISSASTAYGGNSDSILTHEPDVPEITPNIEKWIADTEIILPATGNLQTQNECEANNTVEMKEKISESYCGLKIGAINNEEVVEEGSDIESEIEKSEKTPYPSLQSEQSKEEDYSEEATPSFASPKKSLDFTLYEADVGSFIDSDMPVKFCCRYLVSSFLLAGKPGHLISDKIFRVSVKSLALTCVGYILKLYPHLFTMTVIKESSCNETSQLIADILLFANHSDPQIRGNVAMMIGIFLKSVFVQYGGSFQNFETECSIQKGHKSVLLGDLIKLLINGLNDDSATTCRQTLDALNLCLSELLDSISNDYGLAILTILPKLVKNPYFLVKVKLVDLLSKLSYITIEHITGQSLFQEHFIEVIITLLGDQDQRVRHAASDAIVKSIPCLYFRHPQEDTVTKKATQYTQQFLNTVTSSISELSSYQEKHKPFVNTSVKPFVFLNHYNDINYDSTVEYSLSHIVNILTEILTVHSSKYLIYGCCETLFRLSETYPTTVYARGWDCILTKTLPKKSKKNNDRSDTNDISFANEMISSPVSNSLLSLTLPLLTSSTISLDLSTHRHLILLAGNLASGLAICNFKIGSDPMKLWNMCKDRYMELLLTHITRVLNIFVHVVDEVQLIQASTKPVFSSLSSTQTLSPKKKIVSEQKSKEKGEKISLRIGKEHMGTFIGIPHYMRIYDILKAAHSNYLVTLQHEASEMYVSLLNAILDVLSQILEIASVNEAGKIAEEVLCYLKTTVVLSPTATVQCVQQLLKCLFGTNVCAQWSELDVQKNTDRCDTLRDDIGGFYNQCFQYPARQMANTIKCIGNNCRGENEPDIGWIGLLRRKSDRKFSSVFKTLARSSDQKTSVASFIRLFEPMVIKSLKQYTVTSNIALQCQVLMLLSQLVQLKVNYCLLDSDKIFIGFVLKQFEFIEEGHIQQTEDLLPRIFNFLVHLSYEKNHSKAIIGIPKIIQLCDGLMASGQPAITHCIPALAPVIEDIFLIRNGSSSVVEQRELETTRDVLIAMLLRLVEYHEIVELLALCLAESRFSGDGNGEEKWRRWSRLTMDTVLPILAAGKLKIESERAHVALVKLFAAVSPTVFRPVDPLLKILFTASISIDASSLKLKRWLGMINIMLLSLISCAKEEAMLARLLDLNIDVTDVSHLFLSHQCSDSSSSHECSMDPLNVLSIQSRQVPPEHIFARFIFKVINLISAKVFNLLGLVNHKSADPFVGFSDYTANDNYLVHQFAFFLQLCIHMFESGSHCKVANATMQMIQSRNVSDEEKLLVDDLNCLMLGIGRVCPMVTCQWAYLMILLGYNEMSFWSKVLGSESADYIVAHPRSSEKKITCDYIDGGINIQIIRRGGIILFCDYICENLNDVEPLTWLLVNHIEEAVDIAVESPVRDLLTTAIHRNPAASGLLVQAIATKCTDLSRPSFIKRLLQCIEGAHHSQSGAVILTLIPRFLSTKYLALSRMAAKIASRRVEILLTTGAEDAIDQLSKDDLVKIMDTLQTTKLARKHGGLVSLLNKLAVQYYDLSPLELDQCRPFNPSTVKSIQLDRNWFLSQVRLRCCHASADNNPMELAQLLKDLDFDDCLSVLSCKEFNLKILKHCIILGARLSVEKCQELEFGQAQCEKDFHFNASPLYVAAKQCLLEHIHYICELVPRPHQIYNPEAEGNNSGKELKYAARFSELLSDALYWEILFTIIPTVKIYMKTLPKLAKYNVAKIDVRFEEDIAKFSMLCLELAHWMIYSDERNVRRLKPHDMFLALSCAAEILRHAAPNKIFGDSARYTWVCSAAISLTRVMESVLTTMDPLPVVDSQALESALRDDDTKDYARACIQMASIVAWLEKRQVEGFSTRDIPPYLFNTIKSLVVSISRQPLVNSYILTPPLVWKRSSSQTVASGPTKCYFPLLPSEPNLLQEVDILEQFIYRVNLLGWISRSQFEEIWMAFLSVLNFPQNENTSKDDVAALIQASSLAVQAITRLLLQTLLLPCPGNPDASILIHHPRDPQLSIHKVSSQKLYAIQELLLWKYEYMNDMNEGKNSLKLDHIFHRGNLERIAMTSDRFTYSQLSVSYLWSLCNLYEDKLNASVLDLKNRRNDALMSASLDLDSCLRFLIEHYTIWISPQAKTPIQLLTEIVKSILAISELFLERSQYQWMLDVCLEISRIYPMENAILHQYLAISTCKAAAVLTPLDLDTLDKVKRIVDINLKSGFLASRVSALHGSLYLLQSAVLTKCEETMNIIHPLAIEYIQKHIDSQDSNSISSQSEEHQGIMWALVFFLLEHAEDTPPDAEAPAVLELVLSLVTSQNLSYGLHQMLLQGLERLVATKSVIGKVAEQIVKIAIDRLKQPSPLLALPALQLLLTCMYTEAADRLNRPGTEEPLPDVEPETLVRSIERISAIFDKIRKGHPMEVEVLCTVLSGVLGDFFPPSEILSKVIGEFLSPQQPHPRLLSAVVFKVCEKACICTEMELLQDWVVFSLPNFIQSLPMAMSTWCLSCFFISASTNHWLRALFPYVQSRIGKYEYEDKKMLCIAASDFYHKLSKESQKKAFVETFEAAAKEPGTPFSDILASF